MKTLIASASLIILGLSGTAFAEALPLPYAESEIHSKAKNLLISIDGTSNHWSVDVGLPDGSAMRVTASSVVQIANAICDIATVRPSGGGLVIYCIAK